MTSVTPGERPSAADALAELRGIVATLNLEQLRALPPYRELEDDEW